MLDFRMFQKDYFFGGGSRLVDTFVEAMLNGFKNYTFLEQVCSIQPALHAVSRVASGEGMLGLYPSRVLRVRTAYLDYTLARWRSSASVPRTSSDAEKFKAVAASPFTYEDGFGTTCAVAGLETCYLPGYSAAALQGPLPLRQTVAAWKPADLLSGAYVKSMSMMTGSTTTTTTTGAGGGNVNNDRSAAAPPGACGAIVIGVPRTGSTAIAEALRALESEEVFACRVGHAAAAFGAQDTMRTSSLGGDDANNYTKWRDLLSNQANVMARATVGAEDHRTALQHMEESASSFKATGASITSDDGMHAPLDVWASLVARHHGEVDEGDDDDLSGFKVPGCVVTLGVCRNPWARVVSWYDACKTGPPAYTPPAPPFCARAKVLEFSEWVVETLASAQLGTPVLSGSSSSSSSGESSWGKGASPLGTCSSYLKDAAGRVLVDRVGRYENLEEDWAQWSGLLNLPQDSRLIIKPHPHQSSGVQCDPKSGSSYRCRYGGGEEGNASLAVKKVYHDDVNWLGYSF
jgi:hypothetical protein